MSKSDHDFAEDGSAPTGRDSAAVQAFLDAGILNQGEATLLLEPGHILQLRVSRR